MFFKYSHKVYLNKLCKQNIYITYDVSTEVWSFLMG